MGKSPLSEGSMGPSTRAGSLQEKLDELFKPGSTPKLMSFPDRRGQLERPSQHAVLRPLAGLFL